MVKATALKPLTLILTLVGIMVFFAIIIIITACVSGYVLGNIAEDIKLF